MASLLALSHIWMRSFSFQKLGQVTKTGGGAAGFVRWEGNALNTLGLGPSTNELTASAPQNESPLLYHAELSPEQPRKAVLNGGLVAPSRYYYRLNLILSVIHEKFLVLSSVRFVWWFPQFRDPLHSINDSLSNSLEFGLPMHLGNWSMKVKIWFSQLFV